VLIRTVHRLWAAADSLEELESQLRALPGRCPWIDPLFAPEHRYLSVVP